MPDQNSLKRMLDRYPRIPLAEYPTPLEYLPNLSTELGRKIYLKRDDRIGPGMGGNKTRKLEYLLAEAKQRGAHKIVSFGGVQSNHARITVAAATKLGFETHLFYFEAPPKEKTGNLLLNQICGAHMHFIPLAHQSGNATLETTNRLVHLLARVRIGRHHFIPVGGHCWRGCLGYVRAALEIDQQIKEMNLDRPHLVMAAGTGGTLAGLHAGLKLLDSPVRPLAIDIGKLWKGFPKSLAHLSGEICKRLGERRSFRAESMPLLESVYAAPQYGVPSHACRRAIQKLARLEGVLLDPVYTGKAFAGLLDLIEKGRFGRDEPIIFLHTGGLPALFAFDERALCDE